MVLALFVPRRRGVAGRAGPARQSRHGRKARSAGARRPTTVGGSTRRTSGAKANGSTCTGPWVGSAIVEIVTQDKKGSPLATGTGFFISNDGKLVTNRHVVEGAAGIVAKTEQGSFFVCKGVLAEPKDADIAILKFEATNVPYLTLATDPHLSPGQKIVVIGNPLGLEGSVSEGIISAIRNDQGLVQITAPISPGSSGSPVMTEDAKVMGVATLQSERGQNLNFAIPVQIVNAALAGIEQKNPASPLAGGYGRGYFIESSLRSSTGARISRLQQGCRRSGCTQRLSCEKPDRRRGLGLPMPRRWVGCGGEKRPPMRLKGPSIWSRKVSIVGGS